MKTRLGRLLVVAALAAGGLLAIATPAHANPDINAYYEIDPGMKPSELHWAPIAGPCYDGGDSTGLYGRLVAGEYTSVIYSQPVIFKSEYMHHSWIGDLSVYYYRDYLYTQAWRQLWCSDSSFHYRYFVKTDSKLWRESEQHFECHPDFMACLFRGWHPSHDVQPGWPTSGIPPTVQLVHFGGITGELEPVGFYGYPQDAIPSERPATPTGTATASAAIATPNGGIEVFARGTNNHLIEYWYSPANGWRSTDLGGDIRDNPVAIPLPGGGIEVFARGADNTLHEWWYTPANSWRNASQGGSIASAPTAFYDAGTGAIEVFARGADNTLREWWYTAADGWRQANLGGDIRDAPFALPTKNGGIEVFARGADNTLREWWYTPANGWRNASQGGSIASAPTAFYEAATGKFEVFARGADNTLREWWYSPTNGWRNASQGGSIRDTPLVMPTTNGGIEVFARGADDTLREWWYTPANGWRNASQGGSVASSPSGFYEAATGKFEIFARGADSTLREWWYSPANGWRHTSQGGSIADV